MTAAHCAISENPNNYEVETFRRDISVSTQAEGGISYTVTRVLVHPDYPTLDPAYDVALLFLSEPTNFGSFTPQWIAINRDPEVPVAGEMSKTIGWGAISETGPGSSILLEVDIPSVSPDTCVAVLGYSDLSDPAYLCAGSEGKDSCYGDSGGPLMVNRNSAWLQIGIVSFGTAGCADPTFYLGVYSRISAFVDWIDRWLLIANGSMTEITTTTQTTSTKTTATRTTYTAVPGQTDACVYPRLPILDGESQFDVLPISGVGSFDSLEVVLGIQHTYFWDLRIRLTRISDDATVTLVNSAGCIGIASSGVSLTFSDSAIFILGSPTCLGSQDATCGGSCTGTNFRTLAGALNNFANGSADGNWRLDILDSWAGDQGTLNSWCLKFGKTAAVPAITVKEIQTETVTATATVLSKETSTIVSTTTIVSQAAQQVLTSTISIVSFVPTTVFSTRTTTLLCVPQTVSVTLKGTFWKTATRWSRTTTKTVRRTRVSTRTLRKTVTRTLRAKRIVSPAASSRRVPVSSKR